MIRSSFFLIFSALFLFPSLLKGQSTVQNNDSSDTQKIRVFLDCRRCDESFIRTEITFINFVRDKEDAQVHLLITRQSSGSGTEFELRILGRKEFKGIDNTLSYNSPDSDTRDEERRGLVRYIKIGLLPYTTQTDVIKNLDISYTPPAGEDEGETPQEDPWNNWIFEVDLRTSFNGEETSKNLFVSTGADAEQITEAWKTELSYDYDFNRRKETFTEEDSLGNEVDIEETFITKSQRFDGSMIKSLSEHWSAGVFAGANTSTRNNIDLAISGGPAIEYNIFPFSEFTEREVSFTYFVTPLYQNYADTTIFNKIQETLVEQRFRARAEFTQPWGQIEGRASYSTFLQDFSKNRLDINMEVDFRVFRGLSVNVSGRYSLINNQISVPKGDITDTEQILNIRERLTSFSFRGSIGIEYTFGSLFNSTVNPRF